MIWRCDCGAWCDSVLSHALNVFNSFNSSPLLFIVQLGVNPTNMFTMTKRITYESHMFGFCSLQKGKVPHPRWKNVWSNSNTGGFQKKGRCPHDISVNITMMIHLDLFGTQKCQQQHCFTLSVI